MAQRILTCYAREHRDGIWEMICVDFDIAVTGRSFSEAREVMEHAVQTYVDDAQALAPDQAKRLLNRRSPWHVRARLALGHAVHSVIERRRGYGRHALLELPCRA